MLIAEQFFKLNLKSITIGLEKYLTNNLMFLLTTLFKVTIELCGLHLFVASRVDGASQLEVDCISQLDVDGTLLFTCKFSVFSTTFGSCLSL